MGFEFYFCEEALKKEKHINNKLLPVIMEVLKFLILVCHVREENLYGFFPSFFFFNAKQHRILCTIGDHGVILFHFVDS